MFYELKEGLVEIEACDIQANTLSVCLCTSEDLSALNEQYFHVANVTIQELMNHKRVHSVNKMDSYYGYCFGILSILSSRQNDGVTRDRIGIYIKSNMFIIVCDDLRYEKLCYDILKKLNPATLCLERVVSTILEGILQQHYGMLKAIEARIERLDNSIMENHIDSFNKDMNAVRKDILVLSHYYDEMIGVCEELYQDENDFFDDKYMHHIRILGDRVNRLASNVHMLRDYTLQVREAYQSQVDINLNQIMYVFTVVTTIFLPLTLIVGWYGMNFNTMPELAWEYGYMFVIALSLSVIVLCVWFFKKKKLFRK